MAVDNGAAVVCFCVAGAIVVGGAAVTGSETTLWKYF